MSLACAKHASCVYMHHCFKLCEVLVLDIQLPAMQEDCQFWLKEQLTARY